MTGKKENAGNYKKASSKYDKSASRVTVSQQLCSNEYPCEIPCVDIVVLGFLGDK